MKGASFFQRAEHIMQLGMVAAGAALGGAVVSHFMDADCGQARRARLRDEMARAARAELRRLKRAGVRSACHVLDHLGDEVRSRAHHLHRGQTTAEDIALAQKVRSEGLGPLGQPLRDISFEAVDGIIRLRGEVGSKAERAKVVGAVRQVDGVRGVIDLLLLRGENPSKKAAILTLHRPAS